ncbi:MAG: hypothetical protein HY554_15450 [Elusimicrobia bacterium]|nr:hypothetical protein [Elusimicrobiota bacterium]
MASAAEAPPAAPQPVKRLPRPVLLVAGGRSKPFGLKALAELLTAGGANRFGGVFNVARQGEFAAGFRAAAPSDAQWVFTLERSRPFAPFGHDAAELGEALRALSELTGSRLDCVAESKAAVEARLYLLDGGDRIAHLVLLSPVVGGLPIQGEAAWLGAKLLPLAEETRKTLEGWATDVKLGPWVWNRELRRLNLPANRALARSRLARLTVVAGAGHDLFAGRGRPGLPLPWWRGDGSAPLAHTLRLGADATMTFEGEGTLHGELLTHPEALRAVADALGNY